MRRSQEGEDEEEPQQVRKEENAEPGDSVVNRRELYRIPAPLDNSLEHAFHNGSEHKHWVQMHRSRHCHVCDLEQAI